MLIVDDGSEAKISLGDHLGDHVDEHNNHHDHTAKPIVTAKAQFIWRSWV